MKSIFLSLVLLTTAVFLPGVATAQSPGAAQANTDAFNLFSEGKYEEAAAAYEKLLKDYPTDAVVPIGQIQLAFTNYFLGRFDAATEMVKKVGSGPPLAEELKQVVDGLLPQILSAKASLMPDSDPKRKTTFQEAITGFTNYITKYPQAQDLESVIYSRAVSNYQIGQFDETVKDTELNVQKFPGSGTVAGSKNLLAIALATQGSMALNKGESKETAFSFYKKASDLLRGIIKDRTDLALYNEANFQLAEILFNQAGFSPETERPALYAEALAAYRAIVPKEEILEMQKEVIAGFPAKRLAAIQARNQTLLKQLDRDNLRELTKLEELKNKTDQVPTAVQKMGEIFFQQGQVNAARTVLNHAAPFLKAEEDTKRNLYFKTMSYAMQGNSDAALAGYEDFQSKHKGDQVADNLPVTIGEMLLAQNKPQDAIRYFDESLALYPEGRFAGRSVVSKASAESRLGQKESAAKTFVDFLGKNPSPEIAVIARAGLANIYKDTGKWDEAIAAYKEVQAKHPGTPQAVESEYWLGICAQQKGDNAGAIPLLEEFAKAHPEHQLAPLAVYARGGALIATGKQDEGMATLAALAEKYPDSQPAPFTYFMRAQHAGSSGKAEEVIALMRQFIEKYPKDDKVFFAYESLAQADINSKKPEEALATYRDFAQKYPESAQAPDALRKIAALQTAAADGLGRYGALDETERARWKTNIEASVATAEEVLKKYPESPQVAFALQTLLQNQRLLVGADIKKAPEIESYFQAFADEAPTPQSKSKILFTLANYVSESDAKKALEVMTSAFDTQVIYTPADLDSYGSALIDQKKYDEAAAVFEKLAKDYPIPAGTAPTKASPTIQEAQAIALFGQARILQEKGQTAEAGKLFEQLKSLYPWSPKVLQADYGIAAAMRTQGKYDEAIALLGGVIRATTATAELRANSMLMFGYLMVEKSKAATDPKQKGEFLANAIDNFIKIAQFYAGVPKAAAEGLWMGSQLLEQQASASTDAKFKTQQLNRAKTFYKQLITDFPNSEFVPKAKERLTALGGN